MLYLILSLVIFLVLVRLRRQANVVAFFHPYCNAGGGGERVLWCGISSLQKKFPSKNYIVFTGDRDATKEQILLKAKQRFGIEIDPDNITFEYLRLRRLVEADLYPRFTLLLQTIFGFVLGFEALLKVNPEVFIDSMGYPFTLPLFKFIGGCKVAAYVHYPTISCDMIDLVERRQESYNNSELIVRSSILSKLKLLYYKIFALVYGLAGKAADVVMVNGSWTCEHIKRLWGVSPVVVFPPCDVSSFLMLEQNAETWFASDNVVRIVSVGQIRPEKNHRLQLEVLKDVKAFAEQRNLKVQLAIAGGCRGAEDEQRARDLKAYAKELGVESDVDFLLNISFDDLLDTMGKSLISIHTMTNEHFGISVVEGLAAGTIMVAHNSAGPKKDIVVKDTKKKQQVGYLADTRADYVKSIEEILSKSVNERNAIREAARDSTKRFSENIAMKLYSIMVYHKSPEGTVRPFKAQYDLSSFGFFQRGSVQEFMLFTGRLLVERSGMGARSSVKENEYYLHCYVRADGLAAVSVTDAEYQARVAMSFMTRVLDDFTAKVPSVQWKQIQTEKDCTYAGLEDLLKKWQTPREADPMTRVQEEVEETKIVMHNTIQSVLDRGEKLDDLVKKSENLSDQSKLFYTQARKMNKCCNYV
ncbi:unnamed protein product [Auanema sp. JU1783]|nr:unnamed protein product [Auanema sp. JU1783]